MVNTNEKRNKISRIKEIISISVSPSTKEYNILQKLGNSTQNKFVIPYFILYSLGICFFDIGSP